MNDILFGNNNKAVIKKLANRSFHSNKMRNVIVAIAIALTTFLFTAVLTIGMGASGTLEYSMAKLMGHLLTLWCRDFPRSSFSS